MSAAEFQPVANDFARVAAARAPQSIARPSLSYWQDAWLRLKRNRRAMLSLVLVASLGLFTIAGPWLWRVDPAAQDLDLISQAPGLPATARIVEPFVAWNGVVLDAVPTTGSTVPSGLRLAERR